MPKGLKIILCFMVAIVSFVLFLYITFPFDALKDRILAGAEKSLKGKYEVQIESISPRLLAGVSLKSVKINKRGEGAAVPVWEADSIKLKASIFSLIFSSPKIKFYIERGSGEIYGRAQLGDNKTAAHIVLEDVDLGQLGLLQSEYGLKVKSAINGEIDLDLNPKQIIRSSGKIHLEPGGIKLMPSKLKAGAMGEIDLPQIIIGAGKSLIDAELKRGAIKIKSFKLEKGDLNFDLKGSIYLSSNMKNLRLNLKGNFSFTEKVGQALPFLFIIEKQKKEDGTFPLTISGRISKPQIKIGDFTLPL